MVEQMMPTSMNDIVSLVGTLASIVSTIIAILTYMDSKRTLKENASSAASYIHHTPNGISQDLISFEPIIQFAVQYNKEVSRYEKSLFAIMIALGILFGSITNNILIGIGAFLGSGLVLGWTVWKAVVKSGSRILRHLIFSQNFTEKQRSNLVAKLNDLKWHSRTADYVNPIISDLKK
jgi:hypothetical protein